MSEELRPPISAYIRAKNEARMIGDVVRAALQVAREVIVVDSGSTDGTQDICRAAGASVIHHEWMGNGHQKRIGEDACANDWVFDLDADEIITKEAAAEIIALFSNGLPSSPVLRTPMAFAPPAGRPWIGFGHQKRHKLYDRTQVRAPAHSVWDQFDLPDDIKPIELSSPLLHYAFRDTAHLVDKLNRNSTNRANNLPPKPMGELVLRIVFAMPFYFAKRYFLDGFVRGGLYGFIFSGVTAYGRWLRDVKMAERRMVERERPPGDG